MRYIHTETGNIIDVKSKISGGKWEKVEEEKTSSTKSKKASGKK